MISLLGRWQLDLPRPATRINQSSATIALAGAQVYRHLSRRLPYYLTPFEAFQLVEATGNERSWLLLRLLWELEGRISDAVCVSLGDLDRKGFREIDGDRNSNPLL